MRINPWLAIGLAGAGLLVAAAGFASAHPGSGSPPTGGASRAGFSISGSASGLYPGETAPLTLTVTNPQPFNIQVNSIKTTVGAASASCKGSLLAVGGLSGVLMVPADGTATTAVQTTFSHTAPDACQGVLFPLSFTAKGQQQ